MQQKQLKKRTVKSYSARSFQKNTRTLTRQFQTINTEASEPKYLSKTIQQTGLRSQRQLSQRMHTSYAAEELQEQNQALKGKVNHLAQQLIKMKVKRTQDSRHYLKMQKEVEAQFQEDKYLDMSQSHNRMIQGVKHQYHKMKEKYEDKCKQYEALLRRIDISTSEEQRIECEVLRRENLKLRNKLEMLISTQERIAETYSHIKSKSEYDTSPLRKQNQQEVMLDLLGFSSKMIVMQKQEEDNKFKTSILQAKIEQLRATIDDKEAKIRYLDKIIMEKSNQNHHLLMKERKTAKENKQLAFSLQEARKNIEKGEEQRRAQLQMVRAQEQVRYTTEKSIFAASLREKEEQIEKLTSEIRYVTTLISYINTGEGQIFANPSFDPISRKQSHKEKSDQVLYNLEKSLNILEQGEVRERVKSFFSKKESMQNNLSNNENLRKTLKNSIIVNSDPEQLVDSNYEEEGRGDSELIEMRVVKRSYLKHSPQSRKTKHIKIGQLQSFRLQLIYRLIYYKISADNAKDYFSLESQLILSRKQARWRSKYICYWEIVQKMRKYPFQLDEEHASLMGRYIVEDTTKEDVFFHSDNEIERTIAKSILKAFVGQYLLPDDERAKAQIKQVLQKSGKNLRSALTSLAPTGLISHFKFLEISRGINVDFSEEAQNFIICQLAMKSSGLDKLPYENLFESFQLSDI